MDMSTVAPLLSMDTGMLVAIGTEGGRSRRYYKAENNNGQFVWEHAGIFISL